MLELLFVGSGPHCLTTLLRVLEARPDPSVDSPRRAAGGKAHVLRLWRHQRTSAAWRRPLRAWLEQHVAVVDPTGSWCGRWREQFAGLGIQHARSTSAVHPDPLDSYALVTFAGEAGRTHELVQLEHIAKCEHFHGPFHAPGTSLFNDFVADLVHRYALEGLVTKDKVVGLTPVRDDREQIVHWEADLASGGRLAARSVVLGIGSTNLPRLPAPLASLQPLPPGASWPAAGAGDGAGARAPAGDGCYPSARLLHAWQLAQALAQAAGPAGRPPSPGDLERLDLLRPGERLVIIGGGLTGAHLAQLAAAQLRACPQPAQSPGRRAGQVALLMRGAWRTKQFDVDVAFAGRHRGRELARHFHSLSSLEQRVALMRRVLQGGSMTPEATHQLQQLQAEGLLAVQQHATLLSAAWDDEKGQWDLCLEDGSTIQADRIWAATGSVVDAAAEPLLHQLLREVPIQLVSGLPAIQPSLEWAPGARLFVLGAYAAVQLGPGALNLAGAKTASVKLGPQLMRQLQASGLAPPGSSSTSASGGPHAKGGAKDAQHEPCTVLRGAGALRVAGTGRSRPSSDQQQCCGECWKSRHAAQQARWHARAPCV